MKRSLAAFSLLVLCAATPVRAYYHFLHYGPNGEVIPEKYNLLQIPSKTVTFFVSDAGPSTYTSNDSFASVLNQIRRATKAWNSISTSDLRVAFGGLYTLGTPDNSPGGEVVFEDLPPGVLAYSGPTTCEDTTPDGPTACRSQAPFDGDTFLPILRSTMHMSRDLTRLPGPSFSELFFLVSVHEMGHALGLQHTFTSSTMSTIVTRATWLNRPIDDDDRASISSLYPTAGFSTRFGSISGRVTYSDDGSPAHMASVVAIRSGFPAVSALTLQDGSYQIDGLAPGQYFLYVHPLPPTADIRSPRDSQSKDVDPGRPFNAVLYPSALKTVDASQVPVSAAAVTTGNDFSVAPRSSPPVYDVAMYSFFYPTPSTYNAAHPAFISRNSNSGTVVAAGTGLGDGGNATPGLDAKFMGGTVSVLDIRPYSDDSGSTYLALDLNFSTFGGDGPQHLLFETPDYLYLLPSAINVVSHEPPSISSVAPQADGTVAISGADFQSNTAIYFDALPASVQSRDVANGLITVRPPVGASGQTATLTAFNSDGQNSMFLQLASPPTFVYANVPAASISIENGTLPAGAEARVSVKGIHTHFVQGGTAFAFGSHDVVVRRAFVTSPTTAIVDVGMPAGSAQTITQATTLTDFELAVAPNAFQITAPQAGLPAAVPLLFNAIAGQTGSFAGAIVSLYGSNLQFAPSTDSTVTFNGEAAKLLYTSPNLINLQVPADLNPGLATLVVNNGSIDSLPVTVNIDLPEPVILNVQFAQDALVSDANPLQSGQAADILMAGFPNAGAHIDPSRVSISVGGVSQGAQSVARVGSTAVYDVRFVLPSGVPAGSQTLIVYIDGRSSVQGSVSVADSSSGN